MAMLFFDFDDGRTLFRDREGTELSGLDAAREEVLRTLGEVLRHALPRDDHQTFSAYVRDAAGNSVYSAKVTVEGTWHGSKRCGVPVGYAGA